MGWRDTAGVAAKSDWRATAGVTAAPKAQLEESEAAPEGDALDALKPNTRILQGTSLGFADEALGATDALSEIDKRQRGVATPEVLEADPASNLKPAMVTKSWGVSHTPNVASTPELQPDRSLEGAYRRARDRYREQDKASENAHSLLYGGGELLGTAAIPVPGSGLIKGAGLAAKVGRGAATAAGLGAAIGAGKSEAPDFGGVAKDALKSGAIAAPFGAAGGALEAGLGALGTRFGAGAAKAEETAKGIVEQKALKLMNSALGSLGGEVGAGRNAVEVMKEIVSNPKSTPRQIQAAQSLLDDPQAEALIQRVYKNAINNFPGRMGKIAAAEKGVQEAAEKNTPEALAAAQDELVNHPIKNQILPSMWGRVKRHVVPAIGATLGVGAAHAMGLDGAYGIALGALAGKTSKQLLSHPAVQKLGYGALESGAAGLGSAASKFAPIVGAEEGASLEEAEDKEATLESRFSGKKKR